MKAYQEVELNFMQQVAQQVAVAVDNTLNYEDAVALQRQLERERDRQRLLLQVNNAMVSHLNLEELFLAVSACLRKVIQYDGSSLGLHDQETRRYRVHVLHFAENESFTKEGLLEPEPDCTTPDVVAITTKKPAVFSEDDLKRVCTKSLLAQHLLNEGVKSFCSVPLLSYDRALGALNVGRYSDNSFTQDDVELLSQVAHQIAIAVENALAYKQIAQLKDKLGRRNCTLRKRSRRSTISRKLSETVRRFERCSRTSGLLVRLIPRP